MQERKEPLLHEEASASPTPAAPSPTPRRKRRWVRWLFWSLCTVLLSVLGLLAGAWWWAGQNDSLSRTLSYLADWLPADQTLESRGAQGSLRAGGQIEWLRWSSPAMQVELSNADIAWSLQPLLDRELRFGQIHMQELRLQITPSDTPSDPTQPLQSLELPLHLDVPVRINKLVWEGAPATEINDLCAHYRYTGTAHTLTLDSLRYAGGQYSAKAQLQAQSPMQLQAELQGTVQAPLPEQPDTVLDILATAQIKGTLATEAASLDIQARAHTPNHGDAKAEGLSADIRATVRPWLAQPLERAEADLQRVNLALLLHDGPQTDLTGKLIAGPDEKMPSAWTLQADVQNHVPGAWDQQALPVNQITAQVLFDGQHLWQLQEARITLGRQGHGYLQAQGQFDAKQQTMEGQLQLQAVNPADLYSTLDATSISGQLQASTNAQQEVQFQLDLSANAANAHSQSLRIDQASAKGSWKAPLLHIQQLQLAALQTTVSSDALQFDTTQQHLTGKLQLRAPGLQALLDANASSNQGKGKLDIQLDSAKALSEWMARLPFLNDPLAGASLDGQGQISLAWNGGWDKLIQRFSTGAAAQAAGLVLQAEVQSPQLQYIPKDGEAVTLKNLQLKLNGPLENLTSQLKLQALLGTHSLTLNTQLQGGLMQGKGVAPQDWKLQIAQLQAQWKPERQSDATWQAQLTAPLDISYRTSARKNRQTQIQIGHAGLQLTASNHAVPATVSWDALTLQTTGKNGWGIQSQGTLKGLSLDWVDAIVPSALSNAGISGDLLLQGAWDIDTTGPQLRANVVVERTSGDLRLAVEDSDESNITVVRSSGATDLSTSNKQQQVTRSGRGMRARVQNLQLQLQAQGQALQAQLLWKSERAGQLQMEVSSQFEQNASGLEWPADAPLNGSIRASMPNIGIWAVFAPPGWRVGGSLEADITLAGTRSAPQWRGSLNADKLSIQSLLDGVDFRDGILRTQLQGTQLQITELFLRGGEGSSTRILGQSGNLTAAPKDGGTLTGSGFVSYDPSASAGNSGITMDIRARADKLQVLVRPDRQLSVSGDLKAILDEGQLALTGDLKIDRAAIMLADDSAPTLGADVHITSAALRKAAEEKAAKAVGAVKAAKPPEIRVSINLGDDFALQGFGITTRLEGQLTVTGGPRITGEIHTVKGRYRAWGQSLDVEEGIIRFNGPYDNPALDITALRPNIDVKAGVKVTGSANNPRIALFSDPDMSDAEKLSWIVMGRSTTGGGAEAALLQQAALALLSGGGAGDSNFASLLGFDEIGFKGASDDREQGAALTVGKRLSKELYVAFEQSLSGAMGTLYIFYDLSKHLTLRGQTGFESAVDLIYARTFD